MKFHGKRKTRKIDLEKLAHILESFDIELAVLFGSHARDEAGKFSDLDIGIISEEKNVMDKIMTEILKETGIEAVDLIDLEKCPPGIGYEIARDGKLIIGEEERLKQLEQKFFHLKVDLKPVKEQWQEALHERIRSGEYGKA